MSNVPVIQDVQPPVKKRKTRWRNTDQQRAFMMNWTDPAQSTFANAYKSALKAGYSDSYAKNITHLAPSWLSEYIERTQLTDEHIEAGVTALALEVKNSKSPDDTRLKAYELLARLRGMLNTNNTNITQVNVQPILGGTTKNTDVIDV